VVVGQLVYSSLSGAGTNESNLSSASYKPIAITKDANNLQQSVVVRYFGIEWKVTLHATEAFVKSQQTHTPCVLCDIVEFELVISVHITPCVPAE
jgi:hypothetical protein